MTNQEKFENYMNNKLAPWAIQMVVFAHIFVINAMLIDCIFKG